MRCNNCEPCACLSELLGVLDLLEKNAVLLHAGDAERVGRGADGHDEVVVRQVKVLAFRQAEAAHRKEHENKT